jgi:hypothetical protein
MGEKRSEIRLLGKGKRPLGRPRHRWIDNMKMDLLKTGLGGVDGIGMAKDRYRWSGLENAVMNFQVP